MECSPPCQGGGRRIEAGRGRDVGGLLLVFHTREEARSFNLWHAKLSQSACTIRRWRACSATLNSVPDSDGATPSACSDGVMQQTNDPGRKRPFFVLNADVKSWCLHETSAPGSSVHGRVPRRTTTRSTCAVLATVGGVAAVRSITGPAGRRSANRSALGTRCAGTAGKRPKRTVARSTCITSSRTDSRDTMISQS
jgi:hypothetical protein